MEMQVIFQIKLVMKFNGMDKAIRQCKSCKLLGMFGDMTRRIMEQDAHGHRLKSGNQNIIPWKLVTKCFGKYAIVHLEYNLHCVTNNADLQLLDLNHAMYF